MRIILALLAVMVLCGCGSPSLLITPVYNAQRIQEMQVKPGQGFFPDKIAIIEVEGMLINARGEGLLGSGENKVSLFAQQLEAAEFDSSVKAIVLRVNSPGGTVTASDTMHELLAQFKRRTHKPVIASIQEIGASGAYYVSCAADEIVACPTSVVGSIGVIFHQLNIKGTMQLVGVQIETIKSAKMKDMGSMFRPLDDESRDVMQKMIDEYYSRFKEVVKTGRKSVGDMNIATDGRVFTGLQAEKLGLIDRAGSLDDAIELAKQKANATGAKVISYKRPYGYSGSIYAASEVGAAQEKSSPHPLVQLPEAMTLPSGFYYLWQP